MQVSLAELILLINRTTTEISEKKSTVFKNTIITKDVELNGTETLLTEVESFDEIFNSYKDSLCKLEKYKNALTKANCETKIHNSDITIFEALNKIANFRKELEVYNYLINKKETKDRRFDGNGSNSYYRKTELNFNMNKIEIAKKDIEQAIDKLESLISLTNANTLVDI